MQRNVARPEARAVSIRRYSDRSWSVVEVVGKIDVDVALTLSEMLYANLLSRVVFDLRRASCADASGQAVLTMAWDRITGLGGWVRLVASKESARDFLTPTPLATFVEVFVSVDEATEAVVGNLESPAARPKSVAVGADLLQDTSS